LKILWFIALFIGQMGFLRGQVPADLGVRDNRLKPPSGTPNSVSSQADLYPDHPQRDYARIAPLQFTGDADTAMARLAGILKNADRTVVVSQTADYIYAQSSTPTLRFTDDLEFWLDRSARVIQSAGPKRLPGQPQARGSNQGPVREELSPESVPTAR
jgi:uncharacterized protein (DUF1499 family)